MGPGGERQDERKLKLYRYVHVARTCGFEAETSAQGVLSTRPREPT